MTVERNHEQVTDLNHASRLLSICRWLIILIVVVLFCAIAVWVLFGFGYFRHNSTVVMHHKPSHEYITAAHADGVLKSVSAMPGSRVKKGQVLAEIDQTDLQRQVAHQKRYVALLQQHFKTVQEENDKRKGALEKYFKQLSYNISETEKHVKANRDIVERLLSGQRKLQRSGYVSLVQVNKTQNDYFSAKERLKNLKGEMSQLKLKERTDATQWLQTKNSMQVVILNAKNKLDELQSRLTEDKYIKSPIHGKVSKVLQSVGSTVKSGAHVVSIAKDATDRNKQKAE